MLSGLDRSYPGPRASRQVVALAVCGTECAPALLKTPPPASTGWRAFASMNVGRADRGADAMFPQSPVRRDCELFSAGCSSVRLERTVRDREVGGSNPPTPTIQSLVGRSPGLL